MLGQSGFLSNLFRVFERHRVSIDCIATSEVSVSLTLDSLKGVNFDEVLTDLSKYADVEVHSDRSIIALIANVAKSSDVLAQVFATLASQDVQVEMLSQGASKVNISLIVKDEDLDRTLEALHQHFFEGSIEER